MSREKEPLKALAGIDRLIHEPARLMIMGILHVVVEADFLFILKETDLTRGNLSSHMTKLENAEYIQVKKEFAGKTPRTVLSITDKGREALENYIKQMQGILKSL